MSRLCCFVVLLSLGIGSLALAPCDIYGLAGTPCVAAHSMVRALFMSYEGPLYQVKRATDNATWDVGVITAGGFADTAVQDAFCDNTTCVVQRLYDQSAFENHLDIAPPGGEVPRPDLPVNASQLPLTVNGHAVYGAYFQRGMGYRIDNTTAVATGNQPETIYMVTSGQNFNNGCCFDYGNAEINNHDDGAGTMECVYFGNSSEWGRGVGKGPWVMADLENGLWAGNVTENKNNTPMTSMYVTAMVKGGSNGFAIKAGDATTGTLKTMWDGPRPSGYQPMKKQGAIILGIGGDNSDSAVGTFYEGVMTYGYSTDAADDLVQSNIIAAGYGK